MMVLAYNARVLHECKLLLAIATALKILYVRSKEKAFTAQAKKEAVKRLKKMFDAVGVNKDLDYHDSNEHVRCADVIFACAF